MPLTPKEKVDSVDRQIGACMAGTCTNIVCPYCDKTVLATDQSLCCADLGLAVRAILRRQAQQECLSNAERVLEMVDKIGCN